MQFRATRLKFLLVLNRFQTRVNLVFRLNSLKVKRDCSGLTGPFCSSILQVCDLQTMRQDHTLLSEHGTCPGSRPSSRDRNRRSAVSRGSEPPEVLQKVFGIFINWSKVRVNVTELLQIKVAADETRF